MSPHNVLVGEAGHIKVADFGVAKALGQTHSTTSAGQLKGKINYMAPEQVKGGAIDRRSDLFSLGCCLYEATTGVQPFKGEGDHQVMHRLLQGDLVPPSKVVAGYPSELERIVMRALSPQPGARFPSADRMRLALEEWLTKGPVVTETHVAGAVRARIGAILDKRRERIKASQFTTERVELGGEPPIVEGVTPSMARTPGSGSGVKPAPAGRGSGVDFTQQLPPSPPSSGAGPRASMPSVPPDAYRPVLEARIVDAPRSGSDVSAITPHSTPKPAPRPEGAAYAMIGALLAAIALLALGAIGFFIWRARHAAAPRPPVTAPLPSPSPATPADPAPIDTAITVEAVEPVMFHVSPDAAVLIVDGVEQAAGVRAVTRKPGLAITVIVRAPGYEDATVTINDAYTNKSVVVALRPLKHRSGDPPKRNDPLPANPY
jgi:serine/threonine-protein kinase